MGKFYTFLYFFDLVYKILPFDPFFPLSAEEVFIFIKFIINLNNNNFGIFCCIDYINNFLNFYFNNKNNGFLYYYNFLEFFSYYKTYVQGSFFFDFKKNYYTDFLKFSTQYNNFLKINGCSLNNDFSKIRHIVSVDPNNLAYQLNAFNNTPSIGFYDLFDFFSQFYPNHYLQELTIQKNIKITNINDYEEIFFNYNLPLHKYYSKRYSNYEIMFYDPILYNKLNNIVQNYNNQINLVNFLINKVNYYQVQWINDFNNLNKLLKLFNELSINSKYRDITNYMPYKSILYNDYKCFASQINYIKAIIKYNDLYKYNMYMPDQLFVIKKNFVTIFNVNQDIFQKLASNFRGMQRYASFLDPANIILYKDMFGNGLSIRRSLNIDALKHIAYMSRMHAELSYFYNINSHQLNNVIELESNIVQSYFFRNFMSDQKFIQSFFKFFPDFHKIFYETINRTSMTDLINSQDYIKFREKVICLFEQTGISKKDLYDFMVKYNKDFIKIIEESLAKRIK